MSNAVSESTERRILVVDDEEELLEELASSLQAGGWHVETAADAAEAWKKLDSDDDFTVLLTDIRMPGMDGLSLAKRAHERRPVATAMEVVLITGHGSLDDAATAVRIGAFDFLSKPITLNDLLTAVDRAHQSARNKRAAEAKRLGELTALRAERTQLQHELEAMGSTHDLGPLVPREFSSILSHEMRTPLVALLAVPDLLSQKQT